MLAVAFPPSVEHLPIVADPISEIKSYHSEARLDREISGVLSSIGQLLLKYKMYNRASEVPAVSGGLQQFIINKLKKRGESEKSLSQRLRALYMREESVHFETDIDGQSMFGCLPVGLKLHIFSFLDARSLCQACGVSREWHQLLWDDLLWRRRLEMDKLVWSHVSHTSNPQIYSEAASDMAYKEIYLRCSPEVQASQREESSAFHHVSTVLKYLMPKKVPRMAMFGPGLESSTSGLVRTMLYEDNSMFTKVAMFPGQFEGFGAGMTLRLQNGMSFHLSVLYTASMQERENQNQAQPNRQARNRMLNQQRNAEGEEDVAPSYELQPALQRLCHTLDAFIFVVDATGTKEAVSQGTEELRTMVQERWASPQVPVLILSCVHSASCQRLPAVEVASALQLSTFNRPWMVMDSVVDTLHNVDKGIQWIVDVCQHK